MSEDCFVVLTGKSLEELENIAEARIGVLCEHELEAQEATYNELQDLYGLAVSTRIPAVVVLYGTMFVATPDLDSLHCFAPYLQTA